MATFRDEIARETETLRRQIETVMTGSEKVQQTIERKHDLEIEEIKNIAERDVKEWERKHREALNFLVEACTQIAITAKFHLLEWPLQRPHLHPPVRDLVEVIMAGLPTPPSVPILEGLGLAGAPQQKTLKDALTKR